MKPYLWYCYPTHHTVSFTLVARKHIEILREVYKIEEIPERSFFNICPYSFPDVIMHPFFYLIYKNRDKFAWVRGRYRKIIACDVADSDRVSEEWIDYVNMCDAFLTNSTWSRNSFLRSGCMIPIYVVPHGVEEEFFRPARMPPNRTLKYLLELKRRKNLKYFLFFLWHSGWRKGADLVVKTMAKVQEKRKDVVLIAKIYNIVDPLLKHIQKLVSFTVRGWMERDTLIDLYDICDCVLLFSRGGSFELNGLEALARGKMLFAPDRGAWLDYIPESVKEYALIKTARMVPVLPGNAIHVGYGAEIDVDDAVSKILDAVENWEEYKSRFTHVVEEVRGRFSWRVIGEDLKKIINEIVSK